jgi:DUF4097 and DUF4098 domain-containing protein YvlB
MRSAINIILILFCALTALAREEYKRDFQKTVPLAAGKTFRIDHRMGNIDIRSQPGSQASIHAVIRTSAGSAEEARRLAESIQISVDQSAGGVSVRTTYPSNWNNVSYGVDYDITLPETAPLDVRNRFGGITVDGAHAGASINNANGRVGVSRGRGRLEVENAFGSVDVRGNDGDVLVRGGNGAVTVADVTGTADITNRFGSIQVRNAGRGLTIHSNNGGIEATNVGGATNIANSFGKVIVTDSRGDLFVQNQNGEIQATGVGGAADLHNSFGAVRFSRIGKNLTVRSQNAGVVGDSVGGSATVETSFGNVDLRDIKGGARITAGNSPVRLASVSGEVYAKTSFGGITLTDVAGPVTAENGNGSITVEVRRGPKCQPVSLHTTFAPIRVTLPQGTGYNLNAQTSFGHIRTDFEIAATGEIGRDSLAGKIGGGGCELHLIDQNGSIEILKGQ